MTLPEPIGHRVLVQRDQAVAETEVGLVIPKRAQEIPKTGTIVAVGIGPMIGGDTGLKVGDHIAFSSYVGSEIDIDGTPMLVMAPEDILLRFPSSADRRGLSP